MFVSYGDSHITSDCDLRLSTLLDMLSTQRFDQTPPHLGLVSNGSTAKSEPLFAHGQHQVECLLHLGSWHLQRGHLRKDEFPFRALICSQRHC